MDHDRRRFLLATGALGAIAVDPFAAGARAEDKLGGQKDATNNETDEGISATEDLMREHGVLNRILLIYEEGLRRLRAKQDISPEVFHHTATLVRAFVEDYHEKLEENFIFPEFERRKKLVDLVGVLRQQHEAGRKVTDAVLRGAVADRFRKADVQRELIQACEAFIRLYRPHEAREDTVLFPTLHKIVPAEKIDELGDKFEEEENRLFGDEGFEKTVDQVAAIEKQLGLYDLAQFTPK
jgi:hemerythrin-like domain-containing protein